MKKIFFILGVSALFLSCNKAPETEEDKFKIVMEHLKEHYKEPEYVYMYDDSTKVLGGFLKGAKLEDNSYVGGTLSTASENGNKYFYYNDKGDKVRGYVFLVEDFDDTGTTDGYKKIVIVSESGEIVYCGSEYPQDGGTGECTCKISNLEKCNFEFKKGTPEDEAYYDSLLMNPPI